MNNSFIKTAVYGSSLLILADIFNKIIQVLTFVYVARYLEVETYGKLATILAFVSFFHLFCLPGMNKVLLRDVASNPNNLSSIFSDYSLLRILLCLVGIMICIISSFFIISDGEIREGILIFSSYILLLQFSNFLDIYFRFKEKYAILSVISISVQIPQSLITIFVVVNYYNYFYILISQIIISFCLIIYQIFYIKLVSGNNFLGKPKINRNILISSASFTLISITNLLSNKIDILIIGFLSTPAIVAVYAVAFNLIKYLIVLRNTISSVLLPLVVSNSDEILRNKNKYFFNYTIFFFLSSLLGVLFVITFIDKIIVLLLTEKYIDSAPIIKILLFQVVIVFSNLPSHLFCIMLKEENTILMCNTIMSVLNIPLNFLFFYYFDVIGIAYSTIVVFTAGNLFLISKTFYMLKNI